MSSISGGLSVYVGGALGFLLTLCVFSYVIRDNLLFRIAVYIFIGVSAGSVAAIALRSVIFPQVINPILGGKPDQKIWVLLACVTGLLLFSKPFTRFSILGSPVMAFLVGVGAAVGIGGALLGTLFPQIQAATQLFSLRAIETSGKSLDFELLNGVLILFGLLVALASFQFNIGFTRNLTIRAGWKLFYSAGRVFIAITLGVIFSGVYLASLSALTERLYSLLLFVSQIYTLVR